MSTILPPINENTIPVGTMQATLASTTHTSSGTSAEDVYSSGGTAVPTGTFAVYMKASSNNAGVAYIKANGTASSSNFDVVLEPGQESDQIVFTTNSEKTLTSISAITNAASDVIYFTLKG